MDKLEEMVRRQRSPERISIMESVEGKGRAAVGWFVKDVSAKQCEDAAKDLLELAGALRENRTKEIIGRAMDAARDWAPDEKWRD